MNALRRVMAIAGGGLAGTCFGSWLASYLQAQVQILDGQNKFQVNFIPDIRTGAFVAAGLGFGVGVGLLVAALIPGKAQ
jgi:hypothetical protein